MERDGERPHRPSRLSLHQGHHSAGINTARKKRSERYVRYHLSADTLLEEPLHLVATFVLVSLEWVPQTLLGDFPGRPVAPDIPSALKSVAAGGRRELHVAPGGQLPDALVNAPRRRYISV